MDLTREQKRLLMLYEYKSRLNAANTVRRINEAFDDETVKKTAVYDRFNEFIELNQKFWDL